MLPYFVCVLLSEWKSANEPGETFKNAKNVL